MTESMQSPEPSTDAHAEGELFDPAPHRPTRRRLLALGAVATLALAALAATGAIPRALARSETEHEARAAAAVVPEVATAQAQRETGGAPVVLPGTVEPLQEAAIYARASGYVRKWHVDIGAEVKKGQLLAELDLPDVDQELLQARANASQAVASINQARSQLDFARVTSHRFNALAESGVVTQQQTDQATSDYEVRQANLDAARAAHGSAAANVRRIAELRGFGTLVAPFDGVVTMRAAEVGQLVASGTGQGQPLFKVAEDDVVRIFVSVPQLYAFGVREGSEAKVAVRELAGRVFAAKVARTSRELDRQSRALRVEIDVDNADRALVSGMYAKVSLDVGRQDAPLLIPATAALIDANGTRAALVHDGVVSWRHIEIGGDLGDRLAIASGLADGDRVVLAPNDRLVEGMHVHARPTK